MQFEWDEDKALENARKHRVSFEQAQQVFDDPRAVPFEDLKHSHDEARYVMIGMSSIGLLFVSFTYRDAVVRLISARRPEKWMERFMKTKTKRVSKAPALDPRKFKRLPRGSFLAKRGETEPRNTKVRISILLDLDVLNFFKDKAAKAGALAYQTQINQILRAHMEGKGSIDTNALAQDDRFIRAVAERVKQLSPKQRPPRAAKP